MVFDNNTCAVFLYLRLLPPYIIFESKHLWSSWIYQKSFAGKRITVSDWAWVEENFFFSWLSNRFVPCIVDVHRPVLLIFDDHQAQFNTRISKLALDHEIELLWLPAYSTIILQPLDVVTLTKVKMAWRKFLQSHNTQTNSKTIDKYVSCFW